MNAKDILKKAIACDQAGRILEAQNLYQDGIQILMELVGEEEDVSKKKIYYERIKEYIDRAEQIKERVRKHLIRGELIVSLQIDNGSKGYSYQTLFGKYLTSGVKEVLLEEPYLHENFHFQNLITFLELVVKNCRMVKYIRLVTKPDNKSPEQQLTALERIKSDMNKRGISFSIKVDDSLDDRKIVLSNGYIIKIGRGLHFFKEANPTYKLGQCDYVFRECLQTDVNVWHTKNLKA